MRVCGVQQDGHHEYRPGAPDLQFLTARTKPSEVGWCSLLDRLGNVISRVFRGRFWASVPVAGDVECGDRPTPRKLRHTCGGHTEREAFSILCAMLMQQLLNGVVVGSVYALFALGFTLLFGVNHIMNMAYGSVFMWGAFAGLYTVSVLEAPIYVALLVAMVAGALVSVALDVFAFRPLRRRNAPEFSAIVSSIGADLVLLTIAQKASNTEVMRFPFDAFPVVVFNLFGLRVQLLQLVIMGLVVAMVFGLMWYLYRTRFGQHIRSVAFSEQTSRLLGINPGPVNLQVFMISGALAGMAGVLIGLVFNSVHFAMGEPLLMRAFVIIILGGLGSIPGALIAGLAIGIVQTLSVAYVSSGVAEAIVFGALFIVILVRPTGLFGQATTAMRVQRA
jgi:branched-chain amino acid transport system permease protein